MGNAIGMVRNRDQNREPVIRAFDRVIWGNPYRGRKAFLVAGFLYLKTESIIKVVLSKTRSNV
jgi:hypothetical protein